MNDPKNPKSEPKVYWSDKDFEGDPELDALMRKAMTSKKPIRVRKRG